MFFELAHVADPPDMVPYPVVLTVNIVHFFLCDLFAKGNRFQHRAIGVSTSAGVIDLSGTRILVKFPEHIHQIIAMNIIPQLFALVAEDSILISGDRAFHQIRKEAMQFGAGMIGTRETASPENAGLHPEVPPIFLYEDIGSHFGSTEQGMFRMID